MLACDGMQGVAGGAIQRTSSARAPTGRAAALAGRASAVRTASRLARHTLHLRSQARWVHTRRPEFVLMSSGLITNGTMLSCGDDNVMTLM